MRVVVVGGGITGLAAAHRLIELATDTGRDLNLLLVEAGERLGGVIGTVRRDGCTMELGPDSMVTDKPWGLALAKRLGLEAELIGTRQEHRRSFVVRGGRLLPVPEGFQLLAPTQFGPMLRSPIFSWPGKLRMGMDLFIPRRPPEEADADESLGSFVRRRLGREALDRMAQPMIAGIYGADPMRLSLQATMPRFLEMEREHGSVIRGMWARAPRGRPAARQSAGEAPGRGVSGARYGLFVSFRNGLQTLTDALAARIPAENVRLRAPVEAVAREGDGWRIILPGGQRVLADAVILALPAHRSAALLRPVDAALADELAAIPYASAATLTLCYAREEVPHPLDGFGFVVPSAEKLSLLGCTFSHVKYAGRAPEGVALLRAFIGGNTPAGRVCEIEKAELEALVRTDFRRLLGITALPRFAVTWRGKDVMPQYPVGHLEHVDRIERRVEALPGLGVAGNAFRGIGIPDSIHSGEQAAERLFGA